MTIALTILSVAILVAALYQMAKQVVRLRAEVIEWKKLASEKIANDLIEDGTVDSVKVTIGNERYIVSTDDTEGPEQ